MQTHFTCDQTRTTHSTTIYSNIVYSIVMLNYRNHSLHFSARFGEFDAPGSYGKGKQTAKRLSRPTVHLKELEKKNCELQIKLDNLNKCYNELQKGSVHTMWEYCTQKSADISHIPACDPNLIGMFSQLSVLYLHTEIILINQLI